jgi:peptide/nickel transport system permease protein
MARSRRQVSLWLSVGWLALLILAAVFARWIPGLPPYWAKIGRFAEPPNLSVGGLLGTDDIGRSTLSRIVYGSRVSLTIAFSSTLLGLAVGVFLGVLAGYYRRVAEAGATMAANAIAAVPPLLLLLALVTAIGASLTGITIALGLVISEFYIRVAKAAVIANANREYVLAARSLGASDARILGREIIPNLLPTLAAVVPMGMAIMIVVEGSLSFLGFGIPPPNPSWGGMIASAADLVQHYPYVLIGPVGTLFLTVFAFNTVGDYLGSRSDVREVQL